MYNYKDKKNKQKISSSAANIVLSKSLEANISSMKKIFTDVDTTKYRYIVNKFNDDLKFCLVFIDGMVNSKLMNDNVICPLQNAQTDTNLTDKEIPDIISTKVLLANQIKKTIEIEEIIESVVYGDTAIFIEGFSEVLIIDTKGWAYRSIGEPENEITLTGPREGFTESILVNLSMVRRKVRTADLKMKFKTFGERTKTQGCICYINGLAKKEIIDELEKRLEKFIMDGALSVNYLSEFIKDAKTSFFDTVEVTERPDVVVGNLLEGRVALFLDGTPFVVTVPHLFEGYFQSPEDYYISYYYASINRLLRIFSFILTTTVPAIYVAVSNYHQEMLPTELLSSISAARQGVPFPNVIEVVGMMIVFELLREAGVRMSSNMGNAISIVGALVIGQAAVEAKIVSAPMVIIVGLTGITGLMIPKIKPVMIILRFSLVLAASVLGLYGFILAMVVFMIHILSLRSFGVPFFSSTSLKFQDIKDIYIRAPWYKMKTRPKYFSQDKIRSRYDGES